MAAGANTPRLAVFAVLTVLAVGIAACGQGTTHDRVPGVVESHAPAPAPAPRYAPVRSGSRAHPSRLSAKERRQARRALRQLRQATGKPPRNVVTDSGIIP
jgi:hypothetical protein